MRRALPLFLTVVALATLACRSDPRPPVVKGSTMADSAEQVIFGFHAVITTGGVQRGDLFADTAFIFDDQTRFIMRVVNVKFAKDNGAPNGTIRAERGEYSMRTGILDGWGNVVVTTVDGRTLKTPQLRYNKVANLISSDTSFVMTDKDKVESGIGLRTDPNLDHIQTLRNSKATGVIATPPDR
jgi:LPS export ABC transporter protein LptC